MDFLEYSRNEPAAAALAAHYGRTPAAFVRCFGCQQSVNDAERIKGVFLDIGFTLAPCPEEADVILFNTCAVREHAEQRVYGNLGALKGLKAKTPAPLIVLAGCMAVQKTTVDKIKESYPFIDMVLGVNAADELPGALVERLTTRRRALRVPAVREELVEGVPAVRESGVRAFLPIMFGCDNYCSYCVVPYVRGRERSRASAEVLKEFRELVAAGYRDITLLGQNVNSYGRGLDEKLDFSDLLNLLCQTPGAYRVRFMTSHPKDASRKLVDTMVANEHICNHLHLPVQSGSNAVLAKMNRKYTVEDYLALIRYAKSVCPEMTFSSDIMVGFPGETQEDFARSLALVEEVGYTQLFTFIYSKRAGTCAADLPDDTSHSEKSGRIAALLEAQERAVAKVAGAWVGARFTGLVEEPGKTEGQLLARLDNNMLVEVSGPDTLVGQFCEVEVTAWRGAMLQGKLV